MVSNGARDNAQVISMIMPDLKKVVKYMVDTMLTENRLLIEDMVYRAYDPEEYERTGQFKEAWTTDAHVTGDTATGELKYDPDKLSSYDNHHASIIDGQPMDDYLAAVIYEGMSGAIYHSGYAKYNSRFKGQAWAKSRNVWKALLDYFGEQRFRRYFEKAMSHYGIKYKRNPSKIFFVKD